LEEYILEENFKKCIEDILENNPTVKDEVEVKILEIDLNLLIGKLKKL
jgi:hypothetical protein